MVIEERAGKSFTGPFHDPIMLFFGDLEQNNTVGWNTGFKPVT